MNISLIDKINICGEYIGAFFVIIALILIIGNMNKEGVFLFYHGIGDFYSCIMLNIVLFVQNFNFCG